MYIIKKENDQYILYDPCKSNQLTKVKILTPTEAGGLINKNLAHDETGDFIYKPIGSRV